MFLEIENGIDLIGGHIPPLAHDGALRTQEIPFGLPGSGDVGVEELRFLSAGETHLHALLVRVGHVVPETVVPGADNRYDSLRNQAHDPIQVVGTPVIGGASGDFVMRMPVSTRMAESPHEGLHVEELADPAFFE